MGVIIAIKTAMSTPVLGKTEKFSKILFWAVFLGGLLLHRLYYAPYLTPVRSNSGQNPPQSAQPVAFY